MRVKNRKVGSKEGGKVTQSVHKYGVTKKPDVPPSSTGVEGKKGKGPQPLSSPSSALGSQI